MSQTPSNGEGTHEIDLTDAAVFVPTSATPLRRNRHDILDTDRANSRSIEGPLGVAVVGHSASPRAHPASRDATGRTSTDQTDPLPQCVVSTPAGPTGVRPQATVVVFDVSSSVIDQDGCRSPRPKLQRVRALARALAEQPCTPDDRMGAVIFASTSVEVPPIPLASLSVLDSAIKRPPESEIGGGTNLSGALSLVGNVVDRYADHDVTVVLLSDMQVDDPRVVAAELNRLADHHLHLVALGSYDPRFNGAFDTVMPLTGDIEAGDIGQALAAAITHTRKDPNR